MRRFIFWSLFLIISAIFLKFFHIYTFNAGLSGTEPQGNGRNKKLQKTAIANPNRNTRKLEIERYRQDMIKAPYMSQTDNIPGMSSEERLFQHERNKIRLNSLRINNAIHHPSIAEERRNRENFQPYH